MRDGPRYCEVGREQGGIQRLGVADSLCFSRFQVGVLDMEIGSIVAEAEVLGGGAIEIGCWVLLAKGVSVFLPRVWVGAWCCHQSGIAIMLRWL